VEKEEKCRQIKFVNTSMFDSDEDDDADEVFCIPLMIQESENESDDMEDQSEITIEDEQKMEDKAGNEQQGIGKNIWAKCIFCGTDNHQSAHCQTRKYRRKHRKRKRLQELGICVTCLEPGHSACNQHKCTRCSGFHNIMVCSNKKKKRNVPRKSKKFFGKNLKKDGDLEEMFGKMNIKYAKEKVWKQDAKPTNPFKLKKSNEPKRGMILEDGKLWMLLLICLFLPIGNMARPCKEYEKVELEKLTPCQTHGFGIFKTNGGFYCWKEIQ
jgi:putative hemolysin